LPSVVEGTGEAGLAFLSRRQVPPSPKHAQSQRDQRKSEAASQMAHRSIAKR
jgi:hypothetical protein